MNTQTKTGDDAYINAVALVREHAKPSASWLQRQFGVGYNTAAGWLEQMEQAGVVTAPDHMGRRTLLIDGVPPPPRSETQLVIPVDLPNEHRPADDKLRLLIERVERLEEEKKGVGDDIKDVYLELKAVGYDVKVARQIVRLRKMAPDDRKEMEAILDLYKAALGLG